MTETDQMKKLDGALNLAAGILSCYPEGSNQNPKDVYNFLMGDFEQYSTNTESEQLGQELLKTIRHYERLLSERFGK